MDRKEQIILATLELASLNGLGKVSMQMIADKVGIRKASLYSHFSSKEEIIEEMYKVLRSKAEQDNNSKMSIDDLLTNHSLEDVLLFVTLKYVKLNDTSYMSKFYKVILSERLRNKDAAEILVSETNKMVDATKVLFKLLEEKKMAKFNSVENEAMSFALSVNSLLLYDKDMKLSKNIESNLLESYVKQFAEIHDISGGK